MMLTIKTSLRPLSLFWLFVIWIILILHSFSQFVRFSISSSRESRLGSSIRPSVSPYQHLIILWKGRFSWVTQPVCQWSVSVFVWPSLSNMDGRDFILRSVSQLVRLMISSYGWNFASEYTRRFVRLTISKIMICSSISASFQLHLAHICISHPQSVGLFASSILASPHGLDYFFNQ